VSSDNPASESTSGSTGPSITDSGSERREYFRVEDRARFRYRVVEAQSIGTTPADSHFDDAELFWLMRELRTIDRENHNVLRSLAEQNRELGSYLRTLNRKIELLAGAILSLDPDRGDEQPQDISLSEGGMSFLAEPKLSVGSTLALELTLLPAQIGVACYGEVIANRDEPPARTVIRFVQLRDADRQLIARHILQVQIAARRRQQAVQDTQCAQDTKCTQDTK
jgi:hypothetical protein